MAKDPAFLFYPGDWLGGTMGMSFEERGAYLHLLIMQFNVGHMTSHMVGHEVGQLWEKLRGKFQQDEKGLWFNAKLELEKNKRKTFTDIRHNNLKGENQHTKKRGHMTSHMENENENENRSVIENKNSPLIKQIIDHLNVRAATDYQPTSKKTVTVITARINEKWKLEDFIYVINIKCDEWIGGEHEKFLRPETLFGNKFEGYRNQKPTIKNGNNNNQTAGAGKLTTGENKNSGTITGQTLNELHKLADENRERHSRNGGSGNDNGNQRDIFDFNN